MRLWGRQPINGFGRLFRQPWRKKYVWLGLFIIAPLAVCCTFLVLTYGRYLGDFYRYGLFPVRGCLLQTVDVHGVVKDDQGHPIARAKIFVHDNKVYCPNRKPLEVTLTTDANGRFKGRVKDYPLYLDKADIFEIVVSADGYRMYSFDQATYQYLAKNLEIVLSE